MKNRTHFKVSLEIPPSASVEDARQYIEDAVRTAYGQLTGSNLPMHDFDKTTVRVVRWRGGR